MGVRIHAIAKEVGMSSKEMLTFIQDRFDVYKIEAKSASSSVPNLYEDIIKADVKAFLEQQNAKETPAETVEESADASDEKEVVSNESDDVEEIEEVEEEQVEETPVVASKPVSVVPPMSASKPASVVPPMPVSRPASIVPPTPVSKPAPLVPPTPISKPAPLVPPTPVSKPAPLVPPMPVSRPAPAVPPMPVSRPSVPSMPNMGKSPAPVSEASEGAAASSATPKRISIKPPIIVRDFAKMIDLKPFRLISELMDMGIFAAMNQTIEESVAAQIASKHGFELEVKHRGEQSQQQKKQEKKPSYDDPKNLEPRAPIVCILGHVDHGKTTLLDTIRNTNVVDGEAGGITQHTATYQVEHNGKKITFLDTPGHAAFSKMRERGANVTDIAILVVAADDGFMPQTEEALAFAQKAGVPIIVAINKMDSKGANIDKVKRQMQQRGISPEDWGGETLCCGISALNNTNIGDLLELVLLQAEIMELKANPKRPVEGMVIESQQEQGRGATSTLIVLQGTLKAGDCIYSKGNYCRVRALLDDRGRKIDKAIPGTPVLTMGWTGAPDAGETFLKADNEKQARKFTEEYIDEQRKLLGVSSAPKATNLEDLMAAIANKDKKIFKCVVKSDVSGTTEALVACLEDIKSDKVDLEVIDSKVGSITKNDVDLAATAQSAIVAFNVKPENGVVAAAKHKGVIIIEHNIIYELLNQVKDAMKNLLDPEMRENKLGLAEVRALFNVTKGGRVAGCMVIEGMIKRDKFARVFRVDKELAKGRVGTLKRFKEDANEVKAGYECGINVTGFDDYQVGDTIECFEILEIRPDL